MAKTKGKSLPPSPPAPLPSDGRGEADVCDCHPKKRELTVSTAITHVEIRYEQDVVYARQRTRLIAELLGFDRNDQARISTAVSEIARNAFQYAVGGQVEFLIESRGEDKIESKTPRQVFLVIVRDRGPGIADIQAVLEGRCASPTGAGTGLQGARRMVDRFHIETKPGEGTTVFLGKTLPASASPVTPQTLARISETLCKSEPESPLQEIRRHNQELLRAMEELQHRQERLEQLNRELQDANHGVLALHAELDEKAEQLNRTNQLQSRFLADMSHEFRTPLNTIMSLSRLLLDRVDGDLTEEQEKQTAFIHEAAENTTVLINDLLDLAEIDAGKVEIRPRACTVEDIFSGLRGMFKPLLATRAVKLVVEPPHGIPPLYTDDGKVGQILRNFVSNASKFTERGEIRVSARLNEDGTAVLFAVADTGIGIASEDQRNVFDESTRVQSAQAGRSKDAGPGLANCRRLATMLGGRVGVESRLGTGATFTAMVPLRCVPLSLGEEQEPGIRGRSFANLQSLIPNSSTPIEQDKRESPLEKVLLIDNDEVARYVLKDYLADTRYAVLEAADGQQGLRLAEVERPSLIILDLKMPDMSGLEVLERLKSSPATRDIPVVISTAKTPDEIGLPALAAQAAAVLSKAAPMQVVLATLRKASERPQQNERTDHARS